MVVTGIVITTIIAFILVDLVLRILLKRVREAKLIKERERALDIGLKLDVSEEATTLKRVEVKNPKAKILAVDDESIILDSFRKILVIDGYSIDTVEKGSEALGLIRKNDYDFVFTDLKMPEMDGVEVTKAVKHLRPDIDVIIITGYASVDTAVETMKYGAMDYVQKPFTESELLKFVDSALIKRQDKIEKQMKHKVRLVTAGTRESKSRHELNVPAGAFISEQHAWVRIELNGTVRVGLDDFIRKIYNSIEAVILPETEREVKKGDRLFSIRYGNGHTLEIPSPVSGKITAVNLEQADHPEWLSVKPFELSWICGIEPSDIVGELQTLKIGATSIDWYQSEVDRYDTMLKQFKEKKGDADSDLDASEKTALLSEFSKTFLKN